ncbi:hypothetical protein [Hyphomicrobium sp. LHD-15]|uniref:hypothetical protein n=1 Tax=Hyphomicrobium sp. LHD-15 TaxID=3072142 RepID=UPI00280DD24A|nr:hypothetical protein [Hyphomicrobium sp. LHD-15]MDQ8699879.1 hypothetical protein [Hyphomicrobium sp. LHD-15]
MDARLGRWVKAAGSALAIVSVVFIAALFWKERVVLSTFRPGAAGIAALALSAMGYGLLGWVLADAWRQLLLWSGETNVPSSYTRRIYAQTQIAKYIPGNVAQFAGRQVIGRQAGWTHTGLLLSTVFELLSLVCVAAAIAAVTIATGAHDALAWKLLVAGGIAAAFVAGGVTALRISPRLLGGRWPDVAHRLASLRLRDLWPVAAYHTLFFITSGLLFIVVTAVTTGKPVAYEHWPKLIGLLSIAWIVATLTPGAPSGIGVREMMLVAGLAFMTTTDKAILIATLWRAVTVGGDLLFFLSAGFRTSKITLSPPQA